MSYSALMPDAQHVWASFLSGPASLRRLFSQFFRTHRHLAQHERRYLVQWLYTAVRHYPACQAYIEQFPQYDVPEAPLVWAMLLMGETLDDHPLWRALTPWQAWSFCGAYQDIPDWLLSSIPFSQQPAFAYMMKRPGLVDLRVNTLKVTMNTFWAEMKREGLSAERLASSSTAVRLAEHRELTHLPLWQQGWCDVQSECSQYIVAQCALKSAALVIDVCAGSGGKSLAMAARMRNRGTIYACDVDVKRLARLADRQHRLGVHNIRPILLPDEQETVTHSVLSRFIGKADVVLIDAPCSGSGTWRRYPELNWRMRPSDRARIHQKQAHILREAAHLVKPGGQLLYATCSVFDQDNEAQVAYLLSEHPGFSVRKSEQLWPGQWGEGFYYADCRHVGG